MGRVEEWLASESIWPGELARPLVTLSYAQSLDGSIALRRGQPLALSGVESLTLTHRLRVRHDAILVGIGTILSDDPQLNVRLAEGGHPAVIVLDSKLRFPSNATVAKNSSKPRIFCTSLADAKAQELLVAAGIQVERQADNRTERVELKAMLARLKELGVTTLMVEGGGQVINSFLVENLVDRAVITVSPTYVGGYKILDETRGSSRALPRFKELEFEQYGEDLVVWGELVRLET